MSRGDRACRLLATSLKAERLSQAGPFNATAQPAETKAWTYPEAKRGVATS
jgi:hypothetical protein